MIKKQKMPDAHKPIDPNDLESDLSQLLSLAKAAGADIADAVATHGRSLSISVHDGAVEDVDSSEGRDVGLRVMVGKKQACVSTSDTSAASLKMLAERAVAMARLAPDDPYAALADPALLETAPQDLELFDPVVMDTDQLTERAREVEAAAMQVEHIAQADSAAASASSSAIFFATSHGFRAGWRSSRHSLAVAAIAQNGKEMERDYDMDGTRWLSECRLPSEVGRIAAERAAARLGARQVKSGRLPVMFDRRVAGSLVSALTGAIAGPSISRGVSFLMGKVGEPVFGDHITISDNPLIARGHGSRPWDGEGVRVQARNIIEDGVLTTWLLNTASAAQLGLQTTGHAYRSIGAPPGVASTNLTLHAGDKSRAQLMSDMGDGIIVTDMFGPSLNSNTGDYSVGVSGFKIERGEIAYPVSEITVAGNLIDIFKTLIPADDLRYDGATVSPSLLLGDMTIAGA